MSLSPLTAKTVADYEQDHGVLLPENAVQIAEHINKVGATLREQGAKDAREGRTPLDVAAMNSLVRWAFHLEAEEDPEPVEPVAALWMANYIAGYEEGGENNGR